MKTRSQIGRNNRRKGQTFERVVRDKLKELFPEYAEEIKRGYQYRGEEDYPDVECPFLRVECKHKINPNILSALGSCAEAGAKAKDERTPVAITKKNQCKPVITFYLDDFVEFIKQERSRAIDYYHDELARIGVHV